MSESADLELAQLVFRELGRLSRRVDKLERKIGQILGERKPTTLVLKLGIPEPQEEK